MPLFYQSTNLSPNSTMPCMPSAPPIEQVNPNVLPVSQNTGQIGFVVMSMPPYMSGTPQSMPEMREFKFLP